jgi:type IV pilus assembly protein PilV
MNTRNNQNGVSLIEVLVTLIIISVALLGTASLQVMSKQSNFQAVQRVSAAQLVNDLMQRMRNNREGLDNYLPDDDLGVGSLGTAPAVDCAADAADCTTIQLADYDLWQWEQQIDGAMNKVGTTNAGGLLEPTACITGPAGGGNGIYEVAIAWRGQTEHVNPTIHDCGADSSKYGDANEYRHVLVMETFIEVS